MKRHFLLLFIFMFYCHTENVSAERLVTAFVISDEWYDNIFLIADKVDSMATNNFTVQIGSSGDNVGGELLYNFPNWYNDKFAPALFYEDINGDALKDIVVALISGAGSGFSTKEIHVLNQIHDPNRRFEEVPVESINDAVKRLVKMERQEDQVTILIGEEKYVVNLSKFNDNELSHDCPFAGMLEDYKVGNGVLYGFTTVFVSIGEHVGELNIQYGWNGEMYKAVSISFAETKP
ncbi:hypothetical protein MTP04_04720 [Lysinibacillus sp. PLM2]|nr:hypothetical protein MTP04_04720 [Lysinibacillus sp. PLM2]